MNHFNYETFECASLDQHKHILRKAFALNCGHYVCKQCIKNKSDVLCDICGKKSNVDLEKSKESVIVNKMLNFHLNDLFNTIKTKFSEAITELNHSLMEFNEKLEIHFDYVKEEIEIRAESLKIEIDEISNEFIKNLYEKKMQISRQIGEFHNEFESAKSQLILLKQDINQDLNKSEETFYNYEESMLRLKQITENLKTFNFKIQFEMSQQKLAKQLIGKIEYNDPLLITLKNGFYNSFEFQTLCDEVCTVSHNRILAKDYCSVLLFDENYQLLKTFDSYHNMKIEPDSICSNSKDRIYVTNGRSHQVIMADYDLNPLLSFGSEGSGRDQLSRPSGICFFNGSLFVCDTNNKRIQKLKEDLTYEQSYSLNSFPNTIKIANNVAAVGTYGQLYFYDLPNFTLKCNYTHQFKLTCVIDSYFYAFNGETRTLCCYNNDGSINSQTKMILPSNVVFNFFNPISYFNNKLIVFSYPLVIMI